MDDKNNLTQQELLSELMRLEKELAFYKSALNALPNPIFVKNEEAEFVFFNNAYETFFGVDSKDLIGTKVVDSEYLDDQDKFRYHVEDTTLLENQSTIKYEVPFALASGEIIPSLYWSCGFAADNHQKGLVGEIVAIKQLKEREALLLDRAMNSDSREAISAEILQLSEQIKQFFRTVINYYMGESVLVLEFDYSKNAVHTLVNIDHEDNKDNTDSFKVSSKLSEIGLFLSRLKPNGTKLVQGEDFALHRKRDEQNFSSVHSILFTPLFSQYEELLGIIVVTNPKNNTDKFEIIQSTVPFVVEDLTKSRSYEKVLNANINS